MTNTQRIAGASEMIRRYQGTPWQTAAVAYMRAQVEIVKRLDATSKATKPRRDL